MAPITDPRSVITALASTFSLHPEADIGLGAALVDWLRDRNLLLILDNCEHVLDPVRSIVTDIIASCPHVATLITSRAALDVAGERVIPVPMLSMCDAVELFYDRAAAVGGPIESSDADRDAIVSICERLDGLPLAIELAASRVRALTVADVLSRLDDRFRLLTRGRHGDVEHHQTLQATVEWSYQLLSELERALFERLSVFPSGFDLHTVETVCADDMLDKSEILDLIDGLVSKSMVVADHHRTGIRYRLLETLRHYAAERRREHGDDAVSRSRHLQHYLTVGRHAYDSCASAHQAEGDATFELEWDNIRAAHSWALETADVRAGQDLLDVTGHHAFRRYRHEHEVWATQHLALGMLAPSPSSHGWAASWALLAGALDHAVELALRGIDVADAPENSDATQCWVVVASVQLASGASASASTSAANAMAAAANGADPFGQAWALSVMIEAELSGDRAAGVDRVADLPALADRVGAPSLLARASYHCGQQHLNDTGAMDPRAARDDYSHGVALAQGVGDVFMEQMNQYGVVEATTALRAQESSRVGVDALTAFRATRNWLGIWALLNDLAEWLAFVGDREAAATIYGHLEAHHHPPWDAPAVRQRRSTGLATVRTDSHVAQWMAHGAGMDRDGIVEYTIARLAGHTPPTDR